MASTEKYVATNIIRAATHAAQNGIAYNSAFGIDEDVFYTYIQEFTNLAKIKGLTTRQAQTLFQVCSEYVLDGKLV